MSVYGPTGGVYQPVFKPANMPASMKQLVPAGNLPPLPNFPMGPLDQVQIGEPDKLKEVPVKKFAKIGALVGAGFGLLRVVALPIFSEAARKGMKESPGAAILGSLMGLAIAGLGGAFNASLLAWVFNKTQKKT